MSIEPPGERQEGTARQGWKDVGSFGYIGLFMGIAVAIGTLGGLWLDRRFGTKPWLTIGGALLGIAAGFKELVQVTLKAMRESADANASSDGTDGVDSRDGSGPGGPGDVGG